MAILFNTVSVNGTPGFRNDLSTGNVASLAASGSCTLVFDLAAIDQSSSWRQMVSCIIALSGGVVSTGASIKAFWSDDGSATDQAPAAPCYNVAGGGLNYSGGMDVAVMQLMVMKRFLRVVITNGTTPQGAGTKCHAAFLNV